MNFQQLEYIVALDTYKNFSKAAEACFITQATLSTMVKKLEDELEVIIFDRKTSPIITTDSGREIIDAAKQVLLHTERLKNISAEIHSKIEGELRIDIIPTVSGNLLHHVIPTILEKYPQLKLLIHENTTPHIISRLKSGEIDVGIVSTPLNIKSLEEEILYYEKLMVYGKTKHFKTKYLTPKEISREDIWLLEQGNCITDQIINVCALKSKDLHSNLNFRPHSFDSLLNIVDKMKGLTIIPELYYHDLPEQRKKRVKEFSKPYPVREISMIFHRPYAKLKLIQALSDEIKALITPKLETRALKNSDMKIAKI